MKNSFFIPFENNIAAIDIPKKFILLLHNKPHALCLLAATQLQNYLNHQTDWEHNFGLNPNNTENIIGKMFGVLVVKNIQNQIGFLAAFSGKLANSNNHTYFVPPVFDSLTKNSFLNQGMEQLTVIINEIHGLENEESPQNKLAIDLLKLKRKNHSQNLQEELFNNYLFINSLKESKNAHQIYGDANYKYPPAGAGECATPKLLQHAFKHGLKPLVVAEFWWGQSPKSNHWKHQHYYACCKEKCEPILTHMLKGLEFEYQ